MTTLLTFASMISGALGTFMPVLIYDHDHGKESFLLLMVVQLVFIGGIFVLNLAFFRGQPPTPPSYSSSQPREPFFKGMPMLFKNLDYVKLFIIQMVTMGGLNSFFVNIESWLKPFGFRPKDVSLLAVASTAFSIAGSVLSVLYIKKYKKFKLTIGACLLLGALAMLALTFSLYLEKLWILVLLTGLSGFSLYPIIPNIIELACEIVYPIGEASATGTLMAGGQIASFGIVNTYITLITLYTYTYHLITGY